jgi:serine protease Do
MKRNSLIVGSVVCMALAAGLVSSCKNDPPKEEVKGFPQAAVKNDKPSNGNYINFVPAARTVTPAVVHIKTLYQSGRTAGPTGGSGSGVVISKDGYIATNNHVIENANQIEVIFTDRNSYKARLIGRDPSTDLALLKVEAKDLPLVELGNSDNVEVGEWVLAVGYPFSLNTTVTAGIISAKGRSIGIINSPSAVVPQSNTAIESFLQTDAAINPGNSGGALVDMEGKLVGINTAIASQTGSYAGYAFAIPVNLAKKVLDDLKEFGEVKRGLLGVSFPTPAVEDQYLKQQGINPGSVKGVFITGIQKGSAADEAGLQEGDIIQRIDGAELFSSAELSERIARHHPGDKVELSYLRDGKTGTTSAVLKGEERTLTTSRQVGEELSERLGAVLQELSPALQERFNLRSGVVVSQVRLGGLFHQLGIPPGTIIAYINGRTVESPADVNEALLNARNGRVQILGIAPDGSRIAFTFSLGA